IVHDHVDKAQSVHLFCCVDLASGDQLFDHPAAEATTDERDRPHTGKEIEANLGKAKSRLALSDQKVTRQGRLKTPSEAVTLHKLRVEAGAWLWVRADPECVMCRIIGGSQLRRNPYFEALCCFHISLLSFRGISGSSVTEPAVSLSGTDCRLPQKMCQRG